MPELSTNVNGRAIAREVEARTLLVDFLRDHLDLTGTHVGCDTSQCGACVVLVDGRSVKSCSMLAVEVDGAGGQGGQVGWVVRAGWVEFRNQGLEPGRGQSH